MEMIGVDPLRQAYCFPTFMGRYCWSANAHRYFAAIGIMGGKMVGVDFLGAMKVLSGVACKAACSSGMIFSMAPLLKFVLH